MVREFIAIGRPLPQSKIINYMENKEMSASGVTNINCRFFHLLPCGSGHCLLSTQISKTIPLKIKSECCKIIVLD
jgi:hypothetical protein